VEVVATRVGHVVVFVQENHTTDNYFRWMRAWGANVAADWPLQPNPPTRDQPHNRTAYARWLHAQPLCVRMSWDTAIWHNDHTGQTVKRSLLAYDH